MRLAIIGFTLALVTAALPAAAQDVRVLQDRVQRLEAELVQLQRQVYRGGAVAPAPTTAVGDQGSAVGNLLVRLDALEGQIRDLTGRIEQTEYRNQQVQSRLDKLVEDVDFRLSALERGGRGGETAPPQSGAAAPQPSTLPPGTTPGPGAPPGFLGQPRPPSPPPPPQQQAAVPTAPKVKLPEGTPQERYNYAVKLLQQGDYDDAEVALTEFLAAHPKDPLAANAQYWVGETFFVRTQYDRAAQAFLAGYQKYPKSSKAPDSLLKLAMSLTNLNQKQEACAVLQQLATEYPSAEASVKQGATRERQRAGCR